MRQPFQRIFTVFLAALVVAGYQFGVSRGTRVRDGLRSRLESQGNDLRNQIQILTRSLHQHEAVAHVLESDLKQYLDRAAAGSTDINRMRGEIQAMLTPLLERDQADDLRNTMQELLGPLMRQERLGYDLARLDLETGQRGELPRLLDGIARTGGFSVGPAWPTKDDCRDHGLLSSLLAGRTGRRRAGWTESLGSTGRGGCGHCGRTVVAASRR